MALTSPSVAPLEQRAGRLSAVVPAIDDAQNITPLLERLRSVLQEAWRDHEIVVVAPDSAGEVAEAARRFGAEVRVPARPGYAAALLEGLGSAAGEYVVTLHADGSHAPECIPDLLAQRDRAELVVCSRFAPGSAGRPGALARAFAAGIARALASPVRDPAGGFRLYRRRVLRDLELASERHDVLPEILVAVHCGGWRVTEIPARRAGALRPGAARRRARELLAGLSRLYKRRNHFQAADYDSRAFDTIVWPQRYWQRRRFALVNGMAGGQGRRLDVGCGSSRIIQSAPDSVGLDIEPAKLRFLRRTNRRLLRGSTFALPFADASFDVVVHSQVIEHVPYDEKIFGEVARVLRSDGTLVIGTPDYGRWQWRWTERLYEILIPNGYSGDHITHYTRASLERELDRAGFEVCEHAYILGGELVVRARKRAQGATS